MSFALAPVTVDDVKLPAGFRFTGASTFLSVPSQATYVMRPASSYNLTLDLSPLTLPSSFTLSRSSTDLRNGPRVLAQGLLKDEAVQAQLQGYGRSFLFEAGINMVIGGGPLRFRVDTTAFKTLPVILEAEGPMKKDLRSVEFAFKAEVNKQALQAALSTQIDTFRTGLQRTLTRLTHAINHPPQTVNDTRKHCFRSCGVLCSQLYGGPGIFLSFQEIATLEAHAFDHDLQQMTLKDFEQQGAVVSDEALRGGANMVFAELQDFVDSWDVVEDEHAISMLEAMMSSTDQERARQFVELGEEILTTTHQPASSVSILLESSSSTSSTTTLSQSQLLSTWREWQPTAPFHTVQHHLNHALTQLHHITNPTITPTSPPRQGHLNPVRKSVEKALEILLAQRRRRGGGGDGGAGRVRPDPLRDILEKGKEAVQRAEEESRRQEEAAAQRAKELAREQAEQARAKAWAEAQNKRKVKCEKAEERCRASCPSQGLDATALMAAMKTSQKAMANLKYNVQAALSLIDNVSKSLQWGVTFEGSLAQPTTLYPLNFSLKLAQLTFNFQMKLDLKDSGINKVAALLWGRIKKYLQQKVPGLKDFL
eukprot:TRINITY_DN8636_c0_g1_i4.p1 TRINITY_DN8636_c0_g1~~TRINITY_DN8636_c0_g1_i4.p1  ORF type:complete len:635 (-),score=206.45 TRINITY_DN8636_c0_g1_i4:98-1882(-)